MDNRLPKIPTRIAAAIFVASAMGAVLALGFLAYRGVARAQARKILTEGERIPALTATALDGRHVALGQTPTGDDASGIVLVHFFTSYCGSCRMEIEQIRQAVDEFGDRGFGAVGISIDEDEATVRRMMDHDEMNWPVVRLEGGYEAPYLASAGVSRLPMALLLDGDGTVLRGDVHASELGEILPVFLNDAPPNPTMASR